ncbi:MAG TPA: hypothetical protein DCW72_05000 [Elusimicrobia bacterium]|nr:MAG: hypothetical protein A2X29_11030 [Elusimicrobia bacterium GWA2_64_40]OGR68083.1 MAG: hypothetical protein A2X30_08340 [Elusimicrobia bacterium GWB2_63_16]HAU89596.1 hypothetical protein [Elusimicrobiota bacterium]
MKKTFICVALTVMAGALFAQTPAGKAKPEPAKPAAAAPVVTAQAAPRKTAPEAPAPAKKPEPTKPAPKPVEDQEESVVMIDDRADSDYSRVPTADADEQPAVPGGIPSSYGQCKGVMNDGGRTILVFESADDGAISFVQVTLGKTGAAWKLLDRIYRSAE